MVKIDGYHQWLDLDHGCLMLVRFGPEMVAVLIRNLHLPSNSTGGEAYNYILFQNNNFIGMTAGTLNGGNGYINPAGPIPPHLIWQTGTTNL
ncbi:MAG: hypothetical protein QG625_4532 [Cyanobacteriota bacterium erpe_2018_sw_39hr_WHONDRS-SW48-000098_B_bin.30]|nr:hypothetical protein [Cyanobacteriota bacterium erpe_2018_sw_39hr_WHONDRS-SW48-000098_B_bin.30]